MARGKVATTAFAKATVVKKNTKATKTMKPSGVAWLGDIPEGWEVSRLKNLALDEGSLFLDGDWINSPDITSEGVRYFTTGNIGQGKFKEQGNSFISRETFERLNCLEVHGGDLIVARLNEPIGRACIIPKIYKACIVAVDCVVFRPDRNCFKKYLVYVMSTDQWAELGSLLARGTTMPRISRTQLGNMLLPLPPLSEQRAIADYLDEKCGAIDAAIAEAKKGIEEYKAWKISLIDDVVCNGIVRHKCRKETGEVWLTDIPDEWKFTQIRYLFALRDERNDKPLKDVNLISLYTDKGVVQHVDLEKTTGNKASTADGYKLVYENDIVVNIILCWMGAVGRSAYNGVTSPAYDVYRPIDPKKVLSRYYHYLFRTPRFNGKCYEEGRGIMMMRWRTYSSEFRAIKVPVPPIEEQRVIAAYLDEKCAAIDVMVAEKETLIADLEAYKKSLIYETVTGKREVA